MFKVLVFVLSLFSMASAFKPLNAASSITKNMISMLAVGDAAPDFELLNSAGKSFKLSSFKGKNPVVVFFYPADNTPGCTQEVCAFERRAPDFKSKGAKVFGVSSGGPADKEKFIRTNTLTSMELLIDSADKVRNSWKVPRALFGAFPGRVTYVIGKDGLVKGVYDDLAKAALHPDKALEIIQTLK